MENADRLIARLNRLEGKPYGAYRDLVGTYDYEDFLVRLVRVQSDPYAPPSSLEVIAPLRHFQLEDCAKDPQTRIAAADFIAREFRSGRDLKIAKPGQEILARTSVEILQRGPAPFATEAVVRLRLQVQLPARGRRIMGRAAAGIFDVDLPEAIYQVLDFRSEKRARQLQKQIETYRDHCALQQILAERDWMAFIANGSILARASGISDAPLSGAVPFTSPASRAETIRLPHAGEVTGMAIKRGICIIVGGGYHGKSTLLAAIERGVWAHIPGDGRELVASESAAMKLRAEDGRAIIGSDISMFINDLPTAARTDCFFTENASGSTSQAAAIAEALEADSRTLLIDEDTSATNLMIRDRRMRQLVQAEPITPLRERIEQLRERGFGSIIVTGGSGAYLGCADQVLLLENYRCFDVTEAAGKIAGENPPALTPLQLPRARRPLPHRFSERVKVKAQGSERIVIDREEVEIGALAAVTDPGQAAAIGYALKYALEKRANGERTLAQICAEISQRAEREGLDFLRPDSGFLAQFRAIDLLAAISRFRSLRVLEQ